MPSAAVSIGNGPGVARLSRMAAAPPPPGKMPKGRGLQAWDRVLVRNAPDSNEVLRARGDAAAAALEANAALEGRAVARLTPEQRAQYRQLSGMLVEKPEARLVLQNWLTQAVLGDAGTAPLAIADLLAENRPSLIGSGTLAALAAVATRRLAPGVDRAELLSELVRETAVPTCINQKEKGTCVATSATIKLALADPAEYIRLVGGLAEPAGVVRLANGDTIRSAPDWQARNDGERALVAKLLQPALTNYGTQGEYDNSADEAKWWGLGGSRGTPDWGRDKILEGLFGTSFDTAPVAPWNRDEIFDAMARQAGAGIPTSVAIKWEDDSHAVLVTAVKDGNVYYDNPWGLEESVAIAEFKKQLASVSFDTSAGPFDDTAPARTFGAGLRDVIDGAHHLDLLKVGGGLVRLIGAGAGQLLSASGKYAGRGGDAAIRWASERWKTGGLAARAEAVAGLAGGGTAKGAGLAVKEAGNALSWGLGNV